MDGGYALRQGVHGAFGPLYTNESHTPVYNGWGTTDEDVERMGYAQPFSDMMKGYVKIGKKGKGGSKL